MTECKTCPAYAKCDVTYRGSACAALRASYGLDDDGNMICQLNEVDESSHDNPELLGGEKGE